MNVLLLIDAQIDEIGGVVNAARIAVDQGVEPVGAMQAVAGVRQFVLELLDAIAGEGDEELDALVGRIRVADFVGFSVR